VPTSIELTDADVIGQLGLIVGDHPWAGNCGEIVRIEKTLVGYGCVVRLNDKPDVPYAQECFIFEPKHWKRIPDIRKSPVFT
jgi:hypothetical protein